MQALGREALDMAEAGFGHRAAFVDATAEGRLADDRSKQHGGPSRGVAETARRAAHRPTRRRQSGRGVRAAGAAGAATGAGRPPYFSCTDPLTLAVTLPVPAPTGSASPAGAAIARIIIGRGGFVLPPSVCTLTSRTE